MQAALPKKKFNEMLHGIFHCVASVISRVVCEVLQHVMHCVSAPSDESAWGTWGFPFHKSNMTVLSSIHNDTNGYNVQNKLIKSIS